MNSTPSIFDFSPDIKWQRKLINDVLHKYDYSLGTHVVLCSGSLGSAKSLAAAHLAVRHCLEYSGARVLLGRKALPDLKDTIYKKIVEHLDCDELVEGKDYFLTENIARVRFRNGSEIISRSWSDRKYKKLGSIEISCAIIEELSENDETDEQAFDYIKMRCNRLPHIPVAWLICLTNPDEPDHWVYKRLIDKPGHQTHVYYSKLSDNHFLPDNYESGLRQDMDPLMARRMLDGEWLSILGKGIYYAYSENNRIHEKYEVNPRYPVLISWDFNIGEGKPLSLCLMQIINNVVHIFDEVIVEGMRTEDSCEELHERRLLKSDWTYQIHGDATGRHKDTRNKRSDWDIIKGFFSNYKTKDNRMLRHTFEVMRSNPKIRERHNLVNAYCCNANGELRLFVYNGAETVDQGLRMTKLKKNGLMIEDDSKAFQHVTTAVGYAIFRHKQLLKPTVGPQLLG